MARDRKQKFLYSSRKTETRKQLPVYLILCEGETEQCYFESIQEDIKSLSVFPIKSDKKSIEKMALEASKYKNTKKYSKVFCIFDKNSSNQADYDKGIKIMRENNIQPIFSNQAFEIWILLHFEDFSASVGDQDEYLKPIRKYINNYKKGCKDLQNNPLDLYLKTKEYIDTAIQRADEIKIKNKGHPMDIEPYTDVQELIKRLKEFML